MASNSKKLPFSLHTVATLEGHSDRVWNVAWNPTRSVIASCSADKTVRMWSYNSDSNSFQFVTEIATGHRKTVRSLAWSPSGKTLATASFDSSLSIWEQQETGEEDDGPGEWECVSTLEGHDSECKAVAYSSDGGLIASCSRDKSVWIWEVQPDADFECLSVLMHHTQDVKCLAWHPKEELLASGSYDDTILLYIDDPSDDWYPFATLKGHTSTVWGLAFSPCGSLLASGSDDRTIRIWQRMPRQPIVNGVGAIQLPRGNTPGEGQWELALTINEAHDRSIYSLSWTKGSEDVSDKGWIASGSGDGSIKIWQIDVDETLTVSHKLIAQVDNAHGVADINSVTWSSKTRGLLASAGDDCVSRVWQVSSV